MQMNRTNRGQQMSQRELYDWIAMLGFCAVDMMLYLDTHPDDEDALNYFNQCTELYRNAKAAYEKQYGPLNAFSSTLSTRWEWNEGPMPWEGGRQDMWSYEKRLQYPIRISTPNAKLASYIISQYGGLYCNNL